MPRYLIEAFWSSCRVAKVEILAKDRPPCAGRNAARTTGSATMRRAAATATAPPVTRPGTPTSSRSWPASPATRTPCNEHAGALLAALKALAAHHRAFSTSPEWTAQGETALTAAEAAIAQAEDCTARLVRAAADMAAAPMITAEG